MAVTAKTYLELVNDLIIDSGAELQELTSATFSTTAIPLHKRMKRWIKQAWIEIQNEAEWTWLRKDANLAIYPRWRVSSLNAATAVAGYTFVGDDTGGSITYVSVATESGTLAANNFTGYLNYTDPTNSLKLGEALDMYNGSTLVTGNAVQVTGFGSYKLANEVSDLKTPLFHTMYYVKPSTQTHSSGVADSSPDLVRLMYCPNPEAYYSSFEVAEETVAGDTPQFIVDMGNGYVDLLPRPSEPLLLRFKYIAESQELSAYNDTLTNMPPEYQDVVIWRAMMKYAKWNQKPPMYYFAKDNHDPLYIPMFHEYTPQVAFAGSEYDE